MSFCRKIGLHDALWRSSFGGDIYKQNEEQVIAEEDPSEEIVEWVDEER